MKKKVFLLAVGIVLGLTVIILAYEVMNNGGFSKNSSNSSESDIVFESDESLENGADGQGEEKYYVWNGYVTEEDSVLDEKSVLRASGFFTNIYNKYLEGTNWTVYYAIIPDKNYYFEEESGMLRMDYETMYTLMNQNMNMAEEIELRDCLTLEDYYKTDTHWKQECLKSVVYRLEDKMELEWNDASLPGEDQSLFMSWESYKPELISNQYYGSFHPKSQLCHTPDEFYYLSSAHLDQCKVYDYQNEIEIGIYNFQELEEGKNLYDGFLGGALSLVTITNPEVLNGKELILFRDSFGSSIAPLLTPYYEKITLVDIRYVSSRLLDNWITFEDQDVLFLYSTTVLNNSITLK